VVRAARGGGRSGRGGRSDRALAGGLVAADIGMYQVPNDMVAMVHRNELVMPPGPAGALRDMLERGPGGRRRAPQGVKRRQRRQRQDSGNAALPALNDLGGDHDGAGVQVGGALLVFRAGGHAGAPSNFGIGEEFGVHLAKQRRT
jgi:hypothetical protein